jgi:hypothetical protein
VHHIRPFPLGHEVASLVFGQAGVHLGQDLGELVLGVKLLQLRSQASALGRGGGEFELWNRFVIVLVLESNTFVIPGLCIVWIQLDGFVISLDGFIVPVQVLENNTFVIPGLGVVGIQLDGLVISLDGFIVLVLVIECIAFAIPGRSIVWVEPDRLIKSLDSLIVLD